MNCIISSRKEIQRFQDVQSITFMTPSGQTQILPGHAQAYFLLDKGSLSVRVNGEKKDLRVNETGVCHVLYDEVHIML